MRYEGWDRFYPMFLYRALGKKMKVWEREMIAFYATNPFPEEGAGYGWIMMHYGVKL